MQKTGIEYLDYTCNPIAMRCTPCSPGCENCWHLRTANRLCSNPAMPLEEREALAGTGPFILRERELEALFRLKKPSVIGMQFMGDMFHEDVPDEFIKMICGEMYERKEHTFLVLTKRALRMSLFFQHDYSFLSNPENIYFGLTVCSQQEADAKIGDFLKVPGRRFISYEPALGPVDFKEWLPDHTARAMGAAIGVDVSCPAIDLIIAGGETGPGARPLHPDWVRSVRDQCVAAGTDFFFKQWGEWGLGSFFRKQPYVVFQDGQWTEFTHERMYKIAAIHGDDYIGKGSTVSRVGSKRAARLLDGREWNELPWKEAERGEGSNH